MKPSVLLIGQITLDDTVPSEPGPWQRHLGGNALYSLAGAKLWCDPTQLGMVARVSRTMPFDVFGLLEEASISTQGLKPCNDEPLMEWILYESDGNRQSMPRNPALRDPGAHTDLLYDRYLEHITAISASGQDIPSDWLPAAAVHLAPQVPARHLVTCTFLQGRVDFLSVDPSPHYSRGATPSELHALLPGSRAFLPSQAEVEHMGGTGQGWKEVTAQLCTAGFPEVVLKRGSQGCVLATAEEQDAVVLPTALAQVCDLTGAGDAFSGAYTANRAQGISPIESACRAAVSAAMVIECSGAIAALQLSREDAQRRLAVYQQTLAGHRSVTNV